MTTATRWRAWPRSATRDGTRLSGAEFGAPGAQIIPTCIIGAGSDEIGKAVQIGGSRSLPESRVVTLRCRRDPALRWTRLAVLGTRGGGLVDAAGTVPFRAMCVQHGQRGVLAETSRFVRHDRPWAYLGPVD